jgi:hypothetical protein
MKKMPEIALDIDKMGGGGFNSSQQQQQQPYQPYGQAPSFLDPVNSFNNHPLTNQLQKSQTKLDSPSFYNDPYLNKQTVDNGANDFHDWYMHQQQQQQQPHQPPFLHQPNFPSSLTPSGLTPQQQHQQQMRQSSAQLNGQPQYYSNQNMLMPNSSQHMQQQQMHFSNSGLHPDLQNGQHMDSKLAAFRFSFLFIYL